MKRQSAKDLLRNLEEIKSEIKDIGKVSLDAISHIHHTQGKNELWEKAVEINKIAEKSYNQLAKLETRICFLVISDKKD